MLIKINIKIFIRKEYQHNGGSSGDGMTATMSRWSSPSNSGFSITKFVKVKMPGFLNVIGPFDRRLGRHSCLVLQ